MFEICFKLFSDDLLLSFEISFEFVSLFRFIYHSKRSLIRLKRVVKVTYFKLTSHPTLRILFVIVPDHLTRYCYKAV
jgi:hypothetical protein